MRNSLFIQDEMTVARYLADDAARTALDSYKCPLGDGWAYLDWKYLRDREEPVEWLRICLRWAKFRGLLEQRNRGKEFKVKPEE